MSQLETREGHKVPEVNFQIREGDAWKTVNSKDLFEGRNVIVFALPGAFTPTCSSSHLPRYNELAPVFHENGVDEIVCLSVNDSFVMNAWQADQKAYNIRFLPDGNGEFSKALGFLVDKNDLGFGHRSWRYSMYVSDGVIQKMFIEPNKEGDPFEVSDADTMLDYVAPNAERPKSISLVTKPGCPYCAEAKQLLDAKKLRYEEIVLGRDATAVSLSAISGRTSTPQIFIAGEHIGGADDLRQFLGA